MTMEPERGAKDQTEGEAKKKAHRTGQPKQSAEQVEQEVADVREEIAEHAGAERARAYVFPDDTAAAKRGSES